MADIGSVTRFIHQCPDEAAYQIIWDRYHERVKQHLRNRFGHFSLRGKEDDAANSAFRRLFNYLSEKQGVLEDLFPAGSRIHLEYLLCRLASQRACNEIRKEARHKGEDRRDGGEESGWLARIADPAQAPELAVQLADEVAHLLDKLDERRRQVLILWMEGATEMEIGDRLGCCVATVQRLKRQIREKAQQEGSS